MRYVINELDEGVTMVHVFEHNVFFAWDESIEYDSFRVALNDKGIEAFVDLLIQDANTAYTTFING
jgi:hypothetical protein